jgi:hypothetical protein
MAASPLATPPAEQDETRMIEIVEGLPENVVGIIVKGRMTKRDCSEVLVPAIEKSLKWHHKLRLYYEIRSRFPGAAWEEVDLGINNVPAWERVAMVTDIAWIRHTVATLRLLIPAEIRTFAASQAPEALAWITGAAVRKRGLKPFVATTSKSGERRVFRPPAQYFYDPR